MSNEKIVNVVNVVNVIRAWKDEAYRLSLSDEERALLPENPVGLIELTESDMEMVAGGAVAQTWRCQTWYPYYYC